MSANVFLSHSTADKPALEELQRRLRAKKESRPGWTSGTYPRVSWQPEIEDALKESKVALVWERLGPWQIEFHARLLGWQAAFGNQFESAQVDKCAPSKRFRTLWSWIFTGGDYTGFADSMGIRFRSGEKPPRIGSNPSLAST